jgi:hypothetical protein
MSSSNAKATECCAGVFRVREAKKTGDNLNVGIERNARCGQLLGPAVEGNDNDGENEMKCASGSFAHSG